MSDPIDKPVPDDDWIYQNLGAPDYSRIPNAKQLKLAALQAQRDQEKADVLATLKTEAGQALAMRLLTFCGIHRTTEGDLAAEGRRQAGLWLISEINEADPELYPVLLQNHLKRQRNRLAQEASIADEHRRKAGVVRRTVMSARELIRGAGMALADRVW